MQSRSSLSFQVRQISNSIIPQVPLFAVVSSISRKLDVEKILENYTLKVFNIEGRPKDQITEIERQRKFDKGKLCNAA